MKYKFTTQTVKMPKHDSDVELIFPGGQKIVIQARPSNADKNYNGSLDIILPKDDDICIWEGNDMQPSKMGITGEQHERVGKQIVIELPGGGYD
jgi:hypothetical protein